MPVPVYIIVLISFVTGCALFEPTEEEKWEFEKEKAQYLEQVIEPTFYLLVSTCMNRIEKDEWPIFDEMPGINSVFSEYTIVNSNNNSLQNSFKLKASSLSWNLDITYIEQTRQCDYILNVSKFENPSIMTFRGSMENSALRKMSSEPVNTIANNSDDFPSIFYLVFKAAENSKPYKTPTEYEKLKSSLGEVLFAVGLCILLDVDPQQCR